MRPTRRAAGGTSLAALTGRDLEDYQRHLSATLRTRNAREQARASVRQFWRWRANLHDRLSFDPNHLDTWGEKGNRRPDRENVTDRIPEQVHGPLLVWALRFVDVFAADVLAADREWRQRMRRGRGVNDGMGNARKDIRRRLQELLDGHIAARHPAARVCGRPQHPAAGEPARLRDLNHRPPS